MAQPYKGYQVEKVLRNHSFCLKKWGRVVIWLCFFSYYFRPPIIYSLRDFCTGFRTAWASYLLISYILSRSCKGNIQHFISPSGIRTHSCTNIQSTPYALQSSQEWGISLHKNFSNNCGIVAPCPLVEGRRKKNKNCFRLSLIDNLKLTLCDSYQWANLHT
jgi:hypothetical protein